MQLKITLGSIALTILAVISYLCLTLEPKKEIGFTHVYFNKQWYPILDSSDTSYKITPTLSVSKNYKTK